jgi:ATP-dependent helicase HrpA
LRPQLDEVLLRERQTLWQRWRRLAAKSPAAGADDEAVQGLTAAIAASMQEVAARRAALPTLNWPDLPVVARREEIADAIRDHQVVIVAGETGSGKTTQLPKICLELGRGARGMIGHTQPRRIAARSVATRLAEEIGGALGERVGYQVSFTDQVSEQTSVKVMTDGILLAEIQQDRFLNKYDTLIIDEAHERSLNIDFLLGYLKNLLPRRPDLKLIITSATINLETFSRHFGNAPVIEVSGRTWPIETRYRPLDELVDTLDLAGAVEAALGELVAEPGGLKGDVLVFLPGEREIRETAQLLRKSALPHLDIVPLYARLSMNEQQRVFDLSKRKGTRVVLATNVAETSLTVPGIRYVIDSGLARISRYSYRSKLQRLPIEPISQASAEQRKGRCGRVGPGICVRLYSETDFAARPEFTDAEILRTNLAAVVLQLLSLRLGDVERFPFLDMPDRRQINDGFALLEELGAVDAQRQLTPVGRELARLPADPRLGRMLLEARKLGSLREVLIIAAALSVQDPRERPADRQQAADEQHRRFVQPDSDFLAYVALWDYSEQLRQALSGNQWRKRCEKEFLSPLRLREWRDVHHQLRLACQALGFRENQEPASYDAIHKALLSGLLSHIGQLGDNREYLGARNRKLRIFPGSSLFRKPPRWIVAAEIVETSQVYARGVARIDPAWVLGINDNLLKRRYSEPRWQARQGQVTALETITLYGLVISDKQRVHYGPIDPVVSRELFIRSALVGGDYRTSAPFFAHNQQLVAEIQGLEEKTRRRDILADEEELFRFYDERLPADITTARRFEQWRRGAEREQPKLLFVPRERLMRHTAEGAGEAQFPDHIMLGDMVLQITYRFEPGHPEDGVTVRVPIGLLNRVPQHRFEWLVPGLLRDKLIALVKTLPKQSRKQLVPVPEAVDRLLPRLQPSDRSLLEALTEAIAAEVGVKIAPEEWQPGAIEPFYQVNFRVVDEHGELLGRGRDLAALKEQLREPMTASLRQETRDEFHHEAVTDWNFGRLPLSHSFEQAGVKVTAYPALVDTGEEVAIRLVESPAVAQRATEQGLIRLLQLQTAQTAKYLRNELLRGNQLHLQLAGLSQRREEWLNEILYATYREVFIEGRELPRDEAAFRTLLNAERSAIVPTAQRFGELLVEVAARYGELRQARRKGSELAWLPVFQEIDQQLSNLFEPGFITRTPWIWLQRYPVYLKAAQQRIEKLRGQFQRDRELSRELSPLETQLDELRRKESDLLERNPEALRYRWLLEELRVSLFAQQLGTLEPVSVKRLRDQWQRVLERQIAIKTGVGADSWKAASPANGFSR